jgi:hypothetical protein
MRFGCSWVLSLLLGMTLVGCSGSFGGGQSADGGGDDATDENPAVQGIGAADSAGAHDGTTVDAGHHDATATAETGTTGGEGGGEGGTVAEAGDEGPPPGCGTGDIECSGACVPSDVHNCGTCGHDCTNLAHVAGATSCTTAGACSFPATACAAGWADCDGKPDDGCETDITKPGTCGSCTNVCPANDPVCAGGMCVSGCPVATPKLCSGTCVDTTSNANDCNGCGLACPNNVQNAQPTCVSSACSFTCNGGFTGCPTAAPTGCVDEQHDATNCGGCAKVCPSPSTTGTGQPACAAGVCTLDCNAGLTACPVVNPAECTNTSTDLSNCGTCGDVCKTTVSNATPTCAASQCGFACDTGFLLCDANTCIPAADTVNGAFVSPSGSGSTCTAAQPCTTIAAAIATGKTILYLDQGTYTEVVALAANVTIHGAWTDSAGSWTNCNGTNATSIIAAPAGQMSAVTTTSAGTWTLDTLTVENNTTASAGQSLYGVFANAGSLTLDNVSVSVAGGGAAAASVAQGATGSAPPVSCTAATSNAGANGSPAGAPGVGASQGTYALGGFTAASGTPGQQGNPGTNGGPGAASTNCSSNSCAYPPQAAGCNGAFCCTHSTTNTAACEVTTSCGGSYCGQPGGVGCGAGGGGPGGGGNGGGASVGVFVGNVAVALEGSVAMQTGAGGAGGSGGLGGNPATGSTGATGASTPAVQSCSKASTGGSNYACAVGTSTALLGGAGSTGGNGSAGGAGGGGAGGDSLCYALFGTGQVTGATPTCTPKSGGLGGNQGGGALQGAAGRSAVHN